jgi:hypothetical protein
MVFADEGAESLINTRQPSCQRLPWRKLDRSAAQAYEMALAIHFDNTVAGIFAAAVDAQDSHVRASLSRNGWLS